MKKKVTYMATSDDVLQYLRKHKDILNITGIGRKAGFPYLLRAVNQTKDGHGSIATLPDKYVKPIAEILQKLNSLN